MALKSPSTFVTSCRYKVHKWLQAFIDVNFTHAINPALPKSREETQILKLLRYSFRLGQCIRNNTYGYLELKLT